MNETIFVKSNQPNLKQKMSDEINALCELHKDHAIPYYSGVKLGLT